MEVTERESVQKDLDWVNQTIQRLIRTNEYRDIKHSLYILEKRKTSLIEKLNQLLEIV